MKNYLTLMTVGAVLLTTAASVHAQSTFSEAYKTEPHVAIPDNDPAGIEAIIHVPAGPRTIVSLTVDTITRHTWQGDLRFTLITPWGAPIILTDRPGVPQTTFGFSTDNYGNPATGEKFRWDDAAAHTYDTGSPGTPVTNPVGSWKPENSINDVVFGMDPTGTWKLRVADFAAADTGTLDNFGLNFTMVPEPASMMALGAGLFGLAARRRRTA